jgi:2-amino-4-hydroxy-6-hydroxymethyldihydropteridine diphosphokinase
LNKTLAAVALGSNLGDRGAHLAYAREQLTILLTDLRVSSVIETQPVDVTDAQPPFLNAVAVGSTILSATDLLTALQAIEYARGRERGYRHAARTLDLDLILFGDRVIDEPGVQVPHPRWRERGFVLEPLAELMPDWRDPITSLTVAELLARLRGGRSKV